MSSGEQLDEWAKRLVELGVVVRGALAQARRGGLAMAAPVAQQGGDTIFAVDRHVEHHMISAMEKWDSDCMPLELVAEGLGENGRTILGSGVPKWRLIIDPIDGTRGIMYDKRSAWFLAALVPGDRPARLARCVVSAIVELPTSKQRFADHFVAVAGSRTRGVRVDLVDGSAVELRCLPSGADSIRQGFAQVTNFFPGTKVLAAELMEEIALRTLGEVEAGSAAVYDDQYMSTGGQMVELMMGHDRFCCDLRPLFYQLLEKRSGKRIRGLECHPYDAAGLLAATSGGVIVTDGLGGALDAPLDVHAPVHWCGYANERIRAQIEPVIQRWLANHGVTREP